MSPEQEENLQLIKDDFEVLVDEKYRKGDDEHDGDLIELSPLELLNMSIDEALDQIVYLLTLRRKLVSNS